MSNQCQLDEPETKKVYDLMRSTMKLGMEWFIRMQVPPPVGRRGKHTGGAEETKPAQPVQHRPND